MLVPDGVGLRNFVCTDFVDRMLAAGPLSIWHALPDSLLDEHRARLGPLVSWGLLPTGPDGVATAVLRKARTYAHLTRFRTPSAARPLAGSTGLVTRVVDGTARVAGRAAGRSPRSLHQLDRLYDRVASSRTVAARKRLAAEAPDVVFCTNQRSVPAVATMAAARELGIPTATFIGSWDNLPKGRMVVPSDHFLVWSEKMALDLLSYYPSIDRAAVHVVGTPQFEKYFDPRLVVDRVDFLESLGLDPRRRVVCFSGDDVTTSPFDPEYLADVAACSGDLPAAVRPQVLFRRCPTDVTDRYQRVLDGHPEIAIADPRWVHVEGSEWGEVVPSADDAALLGNVVHHCDVVVNVGSTMAMDFAVLDKPAVYLAYDVEGGRSSHWSVATLYEQAHFGSVHAVQPVHWVRDRSDLGATLGFALEHPGDRSVARRAWLDLELGQDPACASDRCAAALRTIAAPRP